MGRLFNLDSPLMVWLGKITDFIILSFLWFICCIPVITIVPSTSALYYVTLKMVRQEDSKPIRSFFHAFKDNLKQGIPLTLLFLVIGALLILDYLIIGTTPGALGIVMRIIFWLLSVSFAIVMFYTFALQAQFINPIRRTLKNAVILSVLKLPDTVFLFVLHSIPLAVLYFAPVFFERTLPLWLFLVPAVIAYLASLRFVKMFSPMMPETSGLPTEVETIQELK